MQATRWTDLLSDRYDTKGTAFLTHYVSQRIGAVVAAIAFKLGLSPNTITTLGLLLTMAGCWAFTELSITGMVLAFFLWQLAFAFDCADGQLARATGKASAYGKWLDMSCDHIREVVLAFTVAYVLLLQGFSPVLALLAGALHASGALVYLHTAGQLRSGEAEVLNLGKAAQPIRQLVRNFFDLPPFLTITALLQTEPWLLAAFVSFYGFGQLARGLSLGYLRIRAA